MVPKGQSAGTAKASASPSGYQWDGQPFAAFDLHVAQQVGSLKFTPLPSSALLDTGSDLIYRRCHQLPVATAFSADPFEFKVYDTIYGLMGFNPAITYALPPRQDGRGLTMRVDYDVDDWHTLHQDEVVPLGLVNSNDTANSFHSIQLATAAIKRYLDIEDTFNLIQSGIAPGDVQVPGPAADLPERGERHRQEPGTARPASTSSS